MRDGLDFVRGLGEEVTLDELEFRGDGPFGDEYSAERGDGYWDGGGSPAFVGGGPDVLFGREGATISNSGHGKRNSNARVVAAFVLRCRHRLLLLLLLGSHSRTRSPDAVTAPFRVSFSMTSMSCWGKVASSVSSFSSSGVVVGATATGGVVVVVIVVVVLGLDDDATTSAEGFGDGSDGMDAGGVALKRVRSGSILGGMACVCVCVYR
mmetsp:Transcript_17222/g.37379  ORF Transcript_17222/g.37379 Transcript_17222/m.37379 type:complete len:209 (+) Transcript_17222:790-1416(+)